MTEEKSVTDNSGLAKVGVQPLIEHLRFGSSLVLANNPWLMLRNRNLHKLVILRIEIIVHYENE
jgi:hypothetical protein